VRRYLITLLFSLILTGSIWAQSTDSDDDPAAATEAADTAEEAPVAAKEQDETDADDENYADIEDDDFRPSEDIQSDRSISFPTDI